MLDFSARASPSLRNPTSFCYKSLLFGELLQVAIAICENIISHIKPKSNKVIFISKHQKTKKRPKTDRLKFVHCSHPKNRTKEEQGEERKVIGQALGLLVLPGTHITALTPAAYQPGSLPGTLLAYAMGNLILRLASRLDAFSVYPIRT